MTKLQHEFQALGFYLSAHPLDGYRAILERLGAVPSNMATQRRSVSGSSRAKLAGVVMVKQERTAKSGNKFAFVQISDQAGVFEVTVFSELLASRREALEPGKTVFVEADVQAGQGGGSGANRPKPAGENKDGTAPPAAPDVRYIARSIEPLAAAAERVAQGIRIKLYDEDALKELQTLLTPVPQGRGKIVVHLDLDGEEADWELPGAWQLTEAFKQSLRAASAPMEVQEY